MMLHVTIHGLALTLTLVLFLVLMMIVFVLIYSFNKYRLLQHRSNWTGIIQGKITEAIVDGADNVQADESFVKHLREPAFRRLFLNHLVATERKFSGNAQVEVFKLFKVYNLEDEAWKKVQQKQPYLIAGGIQELTAMKVQHAVPKISTFLNHTNRQVYQEAQYALVSFNDFEGLFFLDKLEHPLSDWQQFRLLRSISELPDGYDAKVIEWLNSQNESVVVFALRLLGQFQLLGQHDKILFLLAHTSITVRCQAVRTLQQLENSDTLNQLILTYDEQPIEVQLEILNATKLSGNRSVQYFLQQQLSDHLDVSVKIKAAEVLMALGYVDYLRGLVASTEMSDEISSIVKHALQEKTYAAPK